MIKSWAVENYFVAFVDILGQKNKILSLTHLPKTENEKSEAFTIIEETAGNVVSLRDYFFEFIKSNNIPTLMWRGVSDSNIITVALGYGCEFELPIKSVYSSLYGICGAYILSLRDGNPIRGGADIGWGVPIPCESKEIYGSALERAYSLEHKIAHYPRIVLGNSLISYINIVANIIPKNKNDISARYTANECKDLIMTDSDGCQILDVIGNGVKSIPDGIKQSWIEKAYKFIVKSHEKYLESGNMILYARYSFLRSYFESRVALWDIEPLKSS